MPNQFPFKFGEKVICVSQLYAHHEGIIEEVTPEKTLIYFPHDSTYYWLTKSSKVSINGNTITFIQTKIDMP